MQKYIILAGVLALVSVGGFFLITQQNASEQEGFFAKKQKCGSYVDKIEEKLKEQSLVATYTLDEVFYSPSRNSCLYSYQSHTLKSYYIADYLTNENVWGSGGKDENEARRSWRSTIEQLKQ